METCSFLEAKENSNDDFTKWCSAVAYHANGDFTDAVRMYSSVMEASSRIYYNMAMAYVKLGDSRNAILCLTSAVEKDENLAIAFFQRGTIYLQIKSARGAILDLKNSRLLLRGNLFINYRPLGLLCHLSEFTILYNLALAYLLNGDVKEFRMTLTEAKHNADTFQRNQISDAFKLFEECRFSHIEPIQLSTDAVFVPPKEITKNLGHRKSSKRSMVVFASDEKDNTPSYKCAERAEELRTTLSQNRHAEIKRGGSLKDRLVQKIKSTGDLNISSHVRRNLSARKQRHSTGSVGPDSEIRYKALKEIKQSKETSQNNEHVVTVQSETRPNDRKHIKGGDRRMSRFDKCRFDSAKLIDHFDKDTEHILVSTQVKIDDSANERNSENTRAGFERRFEGKVKSCGDLKNNKKKELEIQSKSTSYLERARSKSLLPLERKKKSRTSFKRLGRPKSVTNEQMIGNTTLLMDGCSVEDDFLNAIVTKDNILPPKELSVNAKSNVDFDVKRNSKSMRKYTLGSVFGDRSTVVKYALTEACDVITATATPTIDPFALKPAELKDKTKVPKQNDKLLVAKQKVKHSSKKKRAPDPPTSNVCSSLLAAGHLFTAMVHHDYDQRAADSMERVDSVTSKTLGKRCFQTKIDSQDINRKRLEIKTSDNTTILEEGSAGACLSNTLDKAFIFPSRSEMEITQDINNNEAASKYDETNKIHPENIHFEKIGEFNAINAANEKEEVIEKRVKDYEDESADVCNQQQKNSVSTRMRNIFKSKRAIQPPPSYPPPPLRINDQKKQNTKYSNKDEISLNGIIGKSLFTSGMMIGALFPTHGDTDAINPITACINRNIDDNSNANELSNLMDAACEIGNETSDENEHVYVNVNKSLEQFPTYMNIDHTNVAGNDITHSQHQEHVGQKQLGETDEVHPVTPNILRAFVLSNDKIRQAFGEFVFRQRHSDIQDNDGLLMNGEGFDDIKHDYVNVTEL